MKTLFFLMIQFAGFLNPAKPQHKAILVKFINQTILFSPGTDTIRTNVNNKLFFFNLLKRDTAIFCKIYDGNRLVSEGGLRLSTDNQEIIALRDGFWKYYRARKKYKVAYFFEDKVVNEKMPKRASRENPLPY